MEQDLRKDVCPKCGSVQSQAFLTGGKLYYTCGSCQSGEAFMQSNLCSATENLIAKTQKPPETKEIKDLNTQIRELEQKLIQAENRYIGALKGVEETYETSLRLRCMELAVEKAKDTWGPEYVAYCADKFYTYIINGLVDDKKDS